MSHVVTPRSHAILCERDRQGASTFGSARGWGCGAVYETASAPYSIYQGAPACSEVRSLNVLNAVAARGVNEEWNHAPASSMAIGRDRYVILHLLLEPARMYSTLALGTRRLHA